MISSSIEDQKRFVLVSDGVIFFLIQPSFWRENTALLAPFLFLSFPQVVTAFETCPVGGEI
jgi:hypothetical protein